MILTYYKNKLIFLLSILYIICTYKKYHYLNIYKPMESYLKLTVKKFIDGRTSLDEKKFYLAIFYILNDIFGSNWQSFMYKVL